MTIRPATPAETALFVQLRDQPNIIIFPPEIGGEIKNELENLSPRADMTLAEIENKMIKFGYDIWPWNQAYKFFLAAVEEKLGEHFFLPKLSGGLREKYLSFKDFGGALKDLQTGRPASFFTSEERSELCAVLVEMRRELRGYLDRELVGIGREQYLDKVEEYQDLLEKIKLNLNALRGLARNESDHPVLAEEIKGRVRDFEHGLCWLGAELNYETVCQAQDFFAGRKIELSRLRGINIPTQIDFFTKEVC